MTSPTSSRGATRRYSIDLDAKLHRRVKIAAVEDDQRVSDIVRVLLEQWLQDRAAQASSAAHTETVKPPTPVRKPILDERAVRFLADAKARAARLQELSKPLRQSPFAPSGEIPLPAAHDEG